MARSQLYLSGKERGLTTVEVMAAYSIKLANTSRELPLDIPPTGEMVDVLRQRLAQAFDDLEAMDEILALFHRNAADDEAILAEEKQHHE